MNKYTAVLFDDDDDDSKTTCCADVSGKGKLTVLWTGTYKTVKIWRRDLYLHIT